MKRNIDNLFAVILNGSATDDEQRLFNEWLKEDELNQETFENIKIYWQINNKELEIINEDDVKNKIWNRSHKSNHTKSRNLIPIIYRVAAVLVFVFTFTFLINEFSIIPKVNVGIVTSKTIEKKNLAGVKSTIHLPDGSIVNLNAESSIKFTEGFKDSVRWVILEGEAFFDVAKNKEKSFIVQSGGIITKALGTAFNINAYEEKSTIDVSLIEGKVEVHTIYEDNPDNSILLDAGQYVSFQNSSVIKSGKFDSKKVIGWKEGVILFENADYLTVIKKLERWYGVKFENEGEEPLWNLDAKFENASLEQILELLSHSEGFEYQLKEDNIKLKMK